VQETRLGLVWTALNRYPNVLAEGFTWEKFRDNFRRERPCHLETEIKLYESLVESPAWQALRSEAQCRKLVLLWLREHAPTCRRKPIMFPDRKPGDIIFTDLDLS
jgi:hypothetical protein